MNYGPQSDFDGAGHPASLAQRQATLRMITADYRGDGHSYTQNGTPLHWENAAGTVASPGELGVMEAVWSAGGALLPRSPARLAGADAACDLPACDTFSPAEGEGHRTYRAREAFWSAARRPDPRFRGDSMKRCPSDS